MAYKPMISILVASSGRPIMFRNMLNSLFSTTSRRDVEVVAVIDADPIALEYAREMNIEVVDYSMQKRGALWAWNRALILSSGDILVPSGDDQLFYQNWLEYALESHKDKLDGYGVVGMNDLAYDGNMQLATMLLFDRKYCKDVMGGVIAPPVYNYYCIDSEWNAKARMLGKFYWDKRSIVEHLHSAHGKREYDDNDREKENAGWMKTDNEIFEKRKAAGFPIEWESVI